MAIEVYLVGGAVRDHLAKLKRPNKDYDFVIVGATHGDMLAAGFCRIDAANFPI